MKLSLYSLVFLICLLSWPLKSENLNPVVLNQDWIFCPAEAYEPTVDRKSLQCYPIEIPGRWESVVPDYNGYGLLTTQFSLDNESSIPNFGLFISQIRDADKAFINGKLIGETGEFPPNFQKGVLYSRNYQIPADYLNYDEINTLSVWIYNDARSGGIVQGAPIIENYFDLLNKYHSANYQMLTLIIMLVIFSIFHFFYYFFHKTAKENLYFGIFVAGWSAYLYTYSNFAMQSGISFNLLFRFNVALFFLAFSLFPLFIYSFFGQQTPKIIKFILTCSLTMIPFCFILPEPKLLYWPLEMIELATVPVIIIIVTFLRRCVINKAPYARPMTGVIALYILFGSIDIVLDITQTMLTDTVWLLGPMALVILSLTLTFLMAHKNYSYYQDATIDRLTSSLRRNEFMLRLEEDIERARRDSFFILVIMIDMDNFKYINDTYGHTQGDKVLTQVTRALKSRLRLFDHIGRYGGDEFCVSASFENKKEIPAFVERLHSAVNGLTFKVTEKEEPVGATFGAVIHPPSQSRQADELLHMADELLIRAKSERKGEILW